MSAFKGVLLAFCLCFNLGIAMGCGKSDKSDKGQNDVAVPVEAPTENTGEGSSTEGLFDESSAFYSAHRIFSAAITWEDGPKVGYCQIKLILGNPNRLAPESIELVKFEPFMTVHGHGGSLRKMTTTKVDGEPSSYRIAMFYLTMSGPWDLNITAQVDGQEDTLVIPIKVP